MSVSRNERCPCGSGRKYKQCCLPGEQSRAIAKQARQSGVGAAMDWLDEHYAEEVAEAIEGGFYGILDDEASDRLDHQPQHMQDLADLNAVDWLLADADLFIEEQPGRSAADVVLGVGGPSLTPEQRIHLEALRDSPLRLYRVERVMGNNEIVLRDVLATDSPPLEAYQGDWAGEFTSGALIGMRLLPGEKPEPSGAMYPYPDALADDVAESIRGIVASLGDRDNLRTQGYDERRLLAKAIASTWIMFLSGMVARAVEGASRPAGRRARRRTRSTRPPFIMDAGTQEPTLLVTDCYEVRDWEKLSRALAAEPDVVGDRRNGWVKVEPGTGPQRSLLAINLAHDKNRIEPFARTRRLADEGRAWLEHLAGDSVRHMSRDIVDPNDPRTLRKLIAKS